MMQSNRETIMIESGYRLFICILSGLVLLEASPLLPPEKDLVLHTGDGNIELSKADSDYRLPNTSRPLHYVIKLNPHLVENNFTFTGETTITLEVLQATNTITIHSKEQTISESRTLLSNYANTTNYTVTHSYDTERDFLTLTTSVTLIAGNYSLSLYYTGDLRDDMIGFYKSSYSNSTGDTIWIATSKFEPGFARYAFPCYDEPALKATVDIWLKRESSQHCLANTPILTEYEDSDDGKTWTVFETTPLISTYLVAFIASDFAGITTDDNTFGVWARSSAIATAQYAFDFGIESLESLENYTGIAYYNYALDKMDQIAIPDFSSGAMENWGLVTYRERYLLYEDGVSTTSDKQNIATVISHEFTHQWFGNLVSPYWWTYLWLNEGFATYFEYFITAEIETDWRLEEQFVVAEIHADAFAADGLGTSHAMNADVETISEIRAIFDSISYGKAGSVIRMMEHMITNSVFKAGLTNYLNTNAFDYGTSDRLWEAIQEAVDANGQSLNVKEVMDTWVTQAGFPVVTVTRDYDENTAVLGQERFFLRDKSLYDSAVYWWVPINWATASDPDYSVTTPTTWIPGNESITIQSPSNSDWILLNKQQTGFYRVNYDTTNWDLLNSFLSSANYTQISPINRAQLIDDALNLARGGYLDYATALNVTKYLAQETDYIPWYSALTGFTYINRLLAQTDSYDNFKTYLTSLLANALETFGYEELDADEHVHKFLRNNVLTWSCRLELDACVEFAKEKLLSWLVDNDETAITPNLKSVVYCTGIRNANSTIWNLMWNKYLATDLSSEQIRILRGLGCSEDTDILNNYMALATTSGSGIRSQDSSTAFQSVYTYGSANNIEPALDYIINNLEAIIEYYGGTSTVTTLLSGIGLRITTSAQLEKLENFATAQSTLLGTAASTGISNAQNNLAWIESYEATISSWLEEAVADSSSSNVGISSALLTLCLVCLLNFYQ
ncbi:aminopeptidase N [Neodiprion lecontei]|uniref:Aminopeptidase n=1 Tax=Neodiprion lecontei TaxID=441921 RepID=A0A6J0BU49_NEOLC|nr:aminopeptidase N [Neodiprion lecontei]